MAKSKKPEENDDLTYLGESVDPDLQKKVDDYMEIEEPKEADIQPTDGNPSSMVDQPDASEADAEVAPPSGAEEPAAGTAPLLPTEELPDMVKEPSSKKATKIAVNHDEEPESSAEQSDESDPADESAPEEPGEQTGEEASTEEENDEIEDDQSDGYLLPTEAIDQIDTSTDATESEAEELAEPIAPIDAEASAAPEFSEEPDYSKTVGEMDTLHLDDQQTSQAIDDIIASDADELLGIEDAKKEAAEPVAVAPPKVKKKSKGNPFKNWFKRPLTRNLTILAALLLLGATVALPTSRYFLLNKAGVKVSTSMKVLDDKTSLPLKNVELVVAGKTSKTDGDGNVRLDGIPLGRQTITIKKPAFAELNKQVTLGWGSNPLGEFRLSPVGNQYAFVLSDFLSDKPVKVGEISYGEASARFSEKGEAVLTVPSVEKEEIEITITADNYRTEKIKVATVSKDKQSIKLVPAKQQIFVSKRSGKFDLYKTDVDGKNEKVILSGSGIEREDSLSIAPHPKKDLVAFASTRENTRNKDGFLLTTLSIINLEDNELTKVTQSERIQIIDWVGDRLVYVKVAQGASEANTSRHRLMSYDAATNTEKELASTNYFNDVLSVNGAIYYSPALYKVNGSVGLYKINADGTNKKTIFQKEVWNLFRTSYDKVSASVGQDWYELNLANDVLAKVGGAPTVLKSRVYVASPDSKQSLWIDERDGKTVLVSYENESKADKVLLIASGIRNPIRWLDSDHIVYRVANGQETADYALSLSGGQPKKIKDVTNTAGIDRWYYY